MADKFLDSISVEEIIEDIGMTKSGRMLVERTQTNEKLKTARNLVDLLDEGVIADRVGLPLDTIRLLKKEMQENNK